MLNFEHATPELLAGLVKAQDKIKNTVKDLEGQEGNRKFGYADLPQSIDNVKGALTEQGISIMQSPSYMPETGFVQMTTVIFHSGGGHISTSGSIPCEKSGAKAFGSASTYMRRYQLLAILFFASEDDDDGSESEGKASKTVPPKPDKITPEQSVEVQQLITMCGENINTKAFLSTFKIASVPQMSVVQYPQAIKMLNKKLETLKAGEQNVK